MAKDIKILGAGISGLTAAITLSEKSSQVIVYESASGLNPKNNISAVRNYEHTDLLEKTRKLSLGLQPCKRVFNVIRHSPSGYYSRTESAKPIFYLFNRGLRENSLEKQLFKQALKKGVEVVFNATTNKADIIATGAKKADIKGYGRIYDGKLDTVHLFYNNKYAPRGYICVLPSKDDYLVLLVSFDRRAFSTLRRRFETFKNEEKTIKCIIAGSEPREEIEGYSNYFQKPVLQRRGAYCVGEAGGFQDASRGFGIWFAMLTGYLAARSIIEGTSYASLIEKHLMNEYRLSLNRRRLFNRFSDRDFDEMIIEMGGEIKLSEYLRKRKA